MAVDNYEITAGQRMMSACTGSIINSVLVTPFDVVRIRLQQQELLVPNGGVQIPKSCCRAQTVFWLSPKDCSNPCASLESTTVRLTGTWQGLKFIGINEGISTLWRGVSLALLIAIPSNVIYFAGYDYLKAHILPQSTANVNPLIAGSFARTMAVVAISPIELVKTRLQAMPNTMKEKNVLAHLLRDTARTIREQGVQTVFKGLNLTLWRDVPFSGVYWLSYEFFKEKFTKLLNYDSSGNALAAVAFASGSFSGTIAAIFTNPFDVGKTRLQVSVDKPATTGRNTLVKTQVSKPKMHEFLLDIVRTEGFGALYTGLTPRILKIAPSCAVMISTYEISKYYFAKDLNNVNNNHATRF